MLFRSDGTASLWIDGERAGKSLQPASGTAGIVLGQADDCQGSARWESLTLSDLYWGMEGGDEDGDGIVNDTDVCIFDADPDQVDTDGDGKGDACDPCPLDALDDRDGDGVCDSDDATPDGDPGDEGYYDSEPHPVDTFMDQGGCGCGTGARAPVLALVLAAAAIGRRSRG